MYNYYQNYPDIFISATQTPQMLTLDDIINYIRAICTLPQDTVFHHVEAPASVFAVRSPDDSPYFFSVDEDVVSMPMFAILQTTILQHSSGSQRLHIVALDQHKRTWHFVSPICRLNLPNILSLSLGPGY